MSAWIERFRSHPLWAQLETLGPIIDKAMTSEGLAPDAHDALHRLKTALIFIGKRLAGADAYIMSLDHLNTINSNITSMISHMNTFVNNHEMQYLDNANSHMDLVLNCLALINVPVTTEDYHSVREAAHAYRTALDESLRGLNGTINQSNQEFLSLRTRLEQLSTEISGEKNRLSGIATDYQSQFSNAQDTRNQQHTEAQNARQEKFSELQMKYSDLLAQEKISSEEHLKEAQRDYDESLRKLVDEIASKGNQLLLDMVGQKEQVEKLVGVIGNLGVTSGYQTTASTARRYVIVWQAVLLITLGVTGWLTFSEILPLLKEELTLQAFVTKVVLLLPLAVLVGYSINQADKYQEVERRTRKQALELEAIGPFLATLPEEKQHEFRLKIGDRSFGASADFVDRRTVKSRAFILDLVMKDSRLRDMLTEFLNKPKG